MGKFERKYLAHYIDANMGQIETQYVRLGKDLEEYSENLNPQVNIQRNLRGSQSVVFSGYQVESSVDSFYAEADDPLFTVLSDMANRRVTGDGCKTTKVDVLVDGSGNQLWAYREDCWIIPVSFGGDTSGVQIPFNVYCDGNREFGVFDVDTKQFSPGGEPTPGPGNIIPLTVSQNGVYSAPEHKAYSPVTVSVPDDTRGEMEIITRTASSVVFSYASDVGRYAFAYCLSLSAFSGSLCTYVSSTAFIGCSSLTDAYFPACSGVGNGAFSDCQRLSNVTLSSCQTIGSSAFIRCYSLPVLSLPVCSYLYTSCFYSCRMLTDLYLLSSSVVTITNSVVFSGTPIGGYSAVAGRYGSVYVPSSLLAAYQSTTNWALISGRIVGI